MVIKREPGIILVGLRRRKKNRDGERLDGGIETMLSETLDYHCSS